MYRNHESTAQSPIPLAVKHPIINLESTLMIALVLAISGMFTPHNTHAAPIYDLVGSADVSGFVETDFTDIQDYEINLSGNIFTPPAESMKCVPAERCSITETSPMMNVFDFFSGHLTWNTLTGSSGQLSLRPAAVPVPSTILLLTTGLIGLAGYRWHQRQREGTQLG